MGDGDDSVSGIITCKLGLFISMLLHSLLSTQKYIQNVSDRETSMFTIVKEVPFSGKITETTQKVKYDMQRRNIDLGGVIFLT